MYLQIVTAQIDQDIQMAKEEIKKKHEEKRKVISYKKLDFKVYGITSKQPKKILLTLKNKNKVITCFLMIS